MANLPEGQWYAMVFFSNGTAGKRRPSVLSVIRYRNRGPSPWPYMCHRVGKKTWRKISETDVLEHFGTCKPQPWEINRAKAKSPLVESQKDAPQQGELL